MEQKVSNKAGWFTLISFICGVITLVTFEEMDSSVKTIENMDEIGAALLLLFSAMTIGGIFWMGMNYWRKTHQELVNLQYTSVTPETIEDYYRATAKAVRKVGFSAIILALMIGVFSQFNSIIEVIGLVVFLFGICICLLSLAPRSIAKQIQKQKYSIMLEVFHETRESKKYCRSLDVAWISTTMDFHDQSWCSRRTVDCHLHHADSHDYDVCEFHDVCFHCTRRKIG
jgi:cell division protein ftsX